LEKLGWYNGKWNAEMVEKGNVFFGIFSSATRDVLPC
jgi:hypothetical protein